MLFVWAISIALFAKFHQGEGQQVTNEQYSSKPDLFYHDNFDNCMLRGSKALYCGLTYKVSPIDKDHPSDTWLIIKNLSDVETNYRHDLMRHWICVPKTCPDVNVSDPDLNRALENCYNARYRSDGIKGAIVEFSCQTSRPKYPFDALDLFAAVLFSGLIVLVFYATVYEGLARYRPPHEYEELMKGPKGVLLSSFSLTRNWIRLKTVKNTPEVEKLRCLQGIRVYNTGLVVLVHTIMSFVCGPVMNTRFTETLYQKNAVVFFSSGPLCVTTFFFISSFLLSNSLFDYMKEKQMTFKTALFILANRLFRLTPLVFFVVLFHATFYRHLGSGPNWDTYVINEFENCRKNGWTNLLYINNLIRYDNMCLGVSWYLGLDTQYFIVLLLFLWFIKKYEKYAWPILGTSVCLSMIANFLHNYYHGSTALIIPKIELLYGLKRIVGGEENVLQLQSIVRNVPGPLHGVAFGYYFSKNKFGQPIFNSKMRVAAWWLLSFGLGFGFAIISGLIILNPATEKNLFWASVYVALARHVMAFSLGVVIIGFSEGIGWLALRVVQWTPTYVLGRLTFSAYLVHMSLDLVRLGSARAPLYVNEYQLFNGFFGDIVLVYIISTLVTLCLELPISELQKHVFAQKPAKRTQENVKDE